MDKSDSNGVLGERYIWETPLEMTYATQGRLAIHMPVCIQTGPGAQ